MKLAKNIKKVAVDVLINEANAIQNLTHFIDHNFDLLVQEILQIKGRVVMTGVGKSAIIASKIVATLNSTGTPALFMHAADAIHGDLGMIQADDLVICVSKSGNTPEVKVLVPLIKRTGVKLVALVSNTQSDLAQQADFVLNATIDVEACPHNLAPTTSTTAHMAMGDALAVALLHARDFSSSDFARYHPGGALGKRLYLKVDDILHANEKPMVHKNAPIREVIMEISSKRMGATAVLDDQEALAGIITDGDLRRMMEQHPDLSGITASEVMSANPKTVPLGTYAVTALNLLQENNISQLIVTNNGEIAGFVHLHDFLKEGIV